jgi:hypothetical protein
LFWVQRIYKINNTNILKKENGKSYKSIPSLHLFTSSPPTAQSQNTSPTPLAYPLQHSQTHSATFPHLPHTYVLFSQHPAITINNAITEQQYIT